MAIPVIDLSPMSMQMSGKTGMKPAAGAAGGAYGTPMGGMQTGYF